MGIDTLFLGGSDNEESACRLRHSFVQETWDQSLVQEDPLGKGMATHSSILAWRSHGQRSLVGYSLWVAKGLPQG